jgi:hypothetical protein
MWPWRAMVMMLAGNNSWLVHQSSLAILPAETSGASRRNGRRSENFAYQYLKYLKVNLICNKIIHVTSGFTSHPKERVLGILIALKNPSPRPGLNSRHLGSVASTLITTPPRRHIEWNWTIPACGLCVREIEELIEGKLQFLPISGNNDTVCWL